MKVSTAECPENFLWMCWGHFLSLPLLEYQYYTELGFMSNRKCIRILISFVCCSVLYLLWLTSTFAFDISIHYTYEIKFKVLILTRSTLISFCISMKETALLDRRFLPCPLPPPRGKDKGQKWQFCLSFLSNRRKETSRSRLLSVYLEGEVNLIIFIVPKICLERISLCLD